MRFRDQYDSRGVTYAKGDIDLGVISALNVTTYNNAAHREAPVIYTYKSDQNKT